MARSLAFTFALALVGACHGTPTSRPTAAGAGSSSGPIATPDAATPLAATPDAATPLAAIPTDAEMNALALGSASIDSLVDLDHPILFASLNDAIDRPERPKMTFLCGAAAVERLRKALLDLRSRVDGNGTWSKAGYAWHCRSHEHPMSCVLSSAASPSMRVSDLRFESDLARGVRVTAFVQPGGGPDDRAQFLVVVDHLVAGATPCPSR